MVTRLQKWTLALTAATGCATAHPPAPGGPALVVRTPDEAMVEARNLADAVAAAEIAWVAGNDRAFARKQLDAAIATNPKDAQARLRRGLLALTELDLAAAVSDLTRTVIDVPGSPETGAALVTLLGWKSELVAHTDALVKELLASGLADSTRRADPFHRAIATALLTRLDGAPSAPALAKTGGWLPTVRIVGPLGPAHDRVLIEPVPLEDAVDWSKRPKFRGVVAPIRTVNAIDGRIPIASGHRRGTYLVQAFFRVQREGEALLQFRVPGFGRVKIDGFTVAERDSAAVRAPSLMARRVRLDSGWHRITLWVTAGGREALSLSLLDEDGRPMMAEVQATAPSAPLIVGAPKLGELGVAAFGRGHPYWLADPDRRSPERALFTRLLAASCALSVWLDDLETGRAYLHGLVDAAPESGALWSTLARLASWSATSDDIVQAHLREAVAKDPSNVGALVGLGRRSVRQDPARALELAERAMSIAPNAFAPFALGFEVYRRKQWQTEAVQALMKAADLGAPTRTLTDGARFLRRSGRVEAAEKLERLAITRAGPRRPALSARRAVRKGDLNQAIEALDTEMPSPTDRVQQAEWALALGDLDTAVKTTKQAIDDDPLLTRAHRVLALAQAAQGNEPAALAIADRLRALGQTSPAQEALAQSWGGPGLDEPPADSWLGRTLKFDPRPFVSPLPGSREPRGLDASDRWAGHGQVRILDRLIDRVQPDGSSITLRHGVTRLQTKEATDRAGEINLPAEALPLNLRTLKPDGSTVDVDRHPGKRDLSFSALAPGDAVEQKWVAVDGPATPWGGYVRRFFFKSTSPVIRAELAVIVPRGFELKYVSYHGAPQPTIQELGDDTVYYWRATDIPPLVPEPGSPHPTEYVPFVVVSVGVDRDMALETRSQRLRSLTRASYDIEQAAAKTVRGIQSPSERTHAVFRWLVDNVSHGKTREPTQVLTRRRGDRTGLLAAMLQAIDIPANVVRARSGRAPVVAPSYPDTADFPSTLVRITLPDESVLWADMDRNSPWLGRLPPWFYGGHYLTRSAAGRPVIRPILDPELATWPIESQLTLEVRPDGHASGQLRIKVPGMLGADLARLFASARREDRERQLQRWLSSLMSSAQLQKLEIEKRSSPLAPLLLTASITVPGFMTVDRGHLVAERFFSTPLVGRFVGQPGLQAYVQLPRRETPLLLSPSIESSTIVIDFPDDVSRPIEGPRTFRRKAAFGRIEQRFDWDDQAKRATLERVRVMPLARIPAAEFRAFRDNAQEVLQAAQNRLIIRLSESNTTAGFRPSDDS